jgi:hypothetical protein
MFDRLLDGVNNWLADHGIDPVIVLTVAFVLILVVAIRDRRTTKSTFLKEWSGTAIWGSILVILFGVLYIIGVVPRNRQDTRTTPDTIETAPKVRGIMYDTTYWHTGWRDSASSSKSESVTDTLRKPTARIDDH